MPRTLDDLYRNVATHVTADDEHRAAMQLLALVMLADHEIADAEVDAVREISEEWLGDGFAFEDYLRPALDDARHAMETDQIDGFLDDIHERVASRVLRSALFSAAREVADADHEVSPEEGTILAAVAVRFS